MGRTVLATHTAASVSALVIVIVGEDESSVRAGHAPSVIDQIAQLPVVLNTPSDFGAVAEFSHVSFFA
jgi:hypothetical protein